MKTKEEKIKQLKNLIDIWHKLTGIIKTSNEEKIKLCSICEHIGLICDQGENIDNYQEVYNWIEEDIKPGIEDLLNQLLPHGSGIDTVWEFEFYKNGSIDCKSDYHVMNDTGMYIYWLPIRVKIFRHKKNVYNELNEKIIKGKVQVIKQKGELDYKCYAAENDYYAGNLKDYLYQCLNDCLENFSSNIIYSLINKNEIKKPFILIK